MVKNKNKYDLKKLKYIIIYPSYWQEYEIDVIDKDTNKMVGVIKTRKNELDAIMKWLESEN